MIRLRYLQYGLLALLVLFVGFGFSCLRLQGDTWPVVLTGELAPGTANGRFTSLGQASVNSSGDIVFKADLDVGGVHGAGIFEVSGGVLFPIALEGQTLPDAPDKSFGAVFSDAQINNAGDIVFTANFATGTTAPPPQGLFLYSGGKLRKLPGQGSFRDVRINDAGDIAFG